MKSTTKLLNKMTQVEIWMYWLWGVLWWSFTYSGSTSSVMTMPPWFPHLDATLGNTVLWATLLRESVPCWNLKRQHECLLVQMYFSKTSLNLLTYSWTWIFQTYHHFLKNHWYVKVIGIPNYCFFIYRNLNLYNSNSVTFWLGTCTYYILVDNI